MPSTSAKITMVVENETLERPDALATTGVELTVEHGLSLWIEADDQHILLDTGQGPAIQTNTAALGVDLAQTDRVVLSHGHYDHTGGLPFALAQATRASVHCHPSALRVRYSVFEGEARSIGIPAASERALAELPSGTVRWVLGPTMISLNVGVTGPVPRLNDYEDTGGPFFLDDKGWRPDPLEDDMALWIRTARGLVVCLGCAHAGVVNTLDWVARLNPGENVCAVIGGLHLMKASEQRIARTAEALLALDPATVVPCHCTGSPAFDALAHILGDRVMRGGSGSVLEF